VPCRITADCPGHSACGFACFNGACVPEPCE
jgi:hypothetical protein